MKGMVLTMKIFAIDLFRYNEKIESIENSLSYRAAKKEKENTNE